MKSGIRCGIGDQDYIAAFDFLVLSWVWRVLDKKGVNPPTILRLKNLYKNGITIPVVNCNPGQAIYDMRGSLRQGGLGSMDWFAVGIDPLLHYLDKRLTGIPISVLPVSGPQEEGKEGPLTPLEERFKGIAFCDDVKPAICSIEEFNTADRGATLFENAAGTKLHRDPTTNKCKFLPLGKWRRELKQDDIPTPYMRLTDTLDMVGVSLSATWAATRKNNGEILRDKLAKLCGAWKSGKFMSLTDRPFSANTYALSKVWFRCYSVNLRQSDINFILSAVKKWLYADLFLKPEPMILFRPPMQGGLGLISVKHKAQACLLRTFTELAINPTYLSSQYLNILYRAHVLNENLPNSALPPYYDKHFFDIIVTAKEEGHDISIMTTKQWYKFLVEREVTMLPINNEPPQLRPCRVELANPDTNWTDVWSKVRLPYLSSEVKSFAWKLLHNLLPSKGRLHEVNPTQSPNCRFCPPTTIANLEHIIFQCCKTQSAGNFVFSTAQNCDPLASQNSILRLNITSDPCSLWIIMSALHLIWISWSQGSSINSVQCRAKLLSVANEMIASESFSDIFQQVQNNLC